MNIYDIAAKCGVSIATVSRVLNNSPSVKAQTRERILAVMQEENYTPNAFARGLGTGSMKLVGLLCTDIRDTFYTTAIGHIEEILRHQGMTTLLRTTGNTPEEKRQALEELVQQGVDGVLLIGSAFQDEEDNSHIATAARRVPVVLVNGYVPLPGVYSITCDEKQAVKELVGILFGRQRRNILLLHDADTYSSRQKIAGYREGYEAAGYTADDQRIVRVERRLDAVNTCIKQLLVKGVSFDAVIGSEDILALGAQKALQRIGLNMPVIGCNNSVLAQCATPELTSIDNRLEELCAAAADALCRLLHHQEVPNHTVLPATLVERDTFRR